MRAYRYVSIIAVSLLGAAATAAELDGTVALECSADQGHDCLPATKQCNRLEPEPNRRPVFAIDFTKKEIHSPFRTALLHVSQTTANSESLIMQGTDLLFAWSALINKSTGLLTISIADRKGAYVVFGQCKPAKTS
jgi:hypothetical protein